MAKTKLNIFDLAMPGIAKETIDFQDGKFGKEMEAFFQNLIDENLTDKDIVKFEKEKDLSGIIKKHTGMRIRSILTGDNLKSGAFIFLPIISRSHILTPAYVRTEVPNTNTELVLKAIEKHKGKNGVDLKTSRVFGVFEEIPAILFFPMIFIIAFKLTARECVALALHEIGHLFTYLEFFDRVSTNNQILASLSNELTNQPVQKERKDLIDKVAKAINVKLDNVEELSLKTDPSAVLIALSTKFFSDDPSQLGSSNYDKTSSESQADIFVARHGYADASATCLYKTGTQFGEENAAIRRSKYYSEILDLFSPMHFGVLAIFLVGGPLPMVIGMTLGIMSFELREKITSKKNFTYDNPVVRYKRLREQLIHLIKDNKINKETLQDTQRQITQIDKLISITTTNIKLMEKIANFLFSKESSELERSIQLQRDLEELSANDIFLASSKLRLLNKPS